MRNKIPLYLLQPDDIKIRSKEITKVKLSFLDKTILNSANAVKSIYLQAESAAKEGFIQKINPHVKLISLIYMAVVISFVSNPAAQVLITAFIFSFYLLAGLKVLQIYGKIFFIALIFGGILYHFSKVLFGNKPDDMKAEKDGLNVKVVFVFLFIVIAVFGLAMPAFLNKVIVSSIAIIGGA